MASSASAASSTDAKLPSTMEQSLGPSTASINISSYSFLMFAVAKYFDARKGGPSKFTQRQVLDQRPPKAEHLLERVLAPYYLSHPDLLPHTPSCSHSLSPCLFPNLGIAGFTRLPSPSGRRRSNSYAAATRWTRVSRPCTRPPGTWERGAGKTCSATKQHSTSSPRMSNVSSAKRKGGQWGREN